jgi:hypothetical protein
MLFSSQFSNYVVHGILSFSVSSHRQTPCEASLPTLLLLLLLFAIKFHSLTFSLFPYIGQLIIYVQQNALLLWL